MHKNNSSVISFLRKLTPSLIASSGSGIILAILYHFHLIPQTQSSILFSMLLLGGAGLFFAWQSGGNRGIVTYLLIGIVGCTIEGIGIVTCRPYGCFSYSSLLGPKFLNTFPFVLIFIRPFLVLSMTHLIPKNTSKSIFLLRGTGLLLFLDLALDPIHISQGIRSYKSGGRHRFGVPLQNFLGWVITGSLSMLIVWERKETISNIAWKYSGIAIMILFWLQFLLLILQG